MSARIITAAELRKEARQLTVCCSQCRKRIRYTRRDRVVSKKLDKCWVVCPGCGHHRVLGIGGYRR